MPEIKPPKPLKCEICGNKFEEYTKDYETLLEYGICIDCKIEESLLKNRGKREDLNAEMVANIYFD